MSIVTAAKRSTGGEQDLFGACRPKELVAIDRLCIELAVAPGRVLLREGEPGRQFLVVAAGRARVDRDSNSLGVVESGSFVGEMSLLDGGPCMATVTAVTPMHLLAFGRTEFCALMDLEIPSVIRQLLGTVARRLRAADLGIVAGTGARDTPGSTCPGTSAGKGRDHGLRRVHLL